jgi:hypothetical protein
VSRHIKCTMKRTLLNSTLDKAPEVVLEVPYRPSVNEEAGGHSPACVDSRAQPGDPDASHTSNKTSKLEVSAMCLMTQHCIPEPTQGKNTLSGEEASSKVDSGRSAIELAKSAAKLSLKIVKEVSDAFPPLKFVAAGLNLIVENADVCNSLTFSLHSHRSCYRSIYS